MGAAVTAKGRCDVGFKAAATLVDVVDDGGVILGDGDEEGSGVNRRNRIDPDHGAK
jgi:hypothetical protein